MSIKIPKSLDDWTYDIIENLINTKITENYDFDFKLELPPTDVLTNLCCSFANTDGGFIVIGIKDANNRFSIRGLNHDKEYTKRFGDRLRSEPRIKFYIKDIEIPKGKSESGKYLYVFHIPKSNQKPHVHNDTEKRKFWKRANGKKELMTLEEIKECFQRELKEENNMLNKTIREDHKFEN
jgi:predicted HTH transcriptional regulator